MTRNRAFTDYDLMAYEAMGAALRDVAEFRLPMGRSSFQGFSPRCAGEAIANVVETCGAKHGADLFPAIKPKAIYEIAQKLDNRPDFKGGTDLSAAAEAYCLLAGNGIRWMWLPSDAAILAAWIRTEQTGVAFGMHWHQQDQRGASSRVLEWPGGIAESGHAVHLFGFKRDHRWHRYNFLGMRFGKERSAPVFLMENTNNSHPELPFYLPASRIAVSGIETVVLIPPTY